MPYRTDAEQLRLRAARRPAPAPAQPADGPQRALLGLQQTAGNAAVQRLVQAKLTVGAAHDAYEQEADAVADAVVGDGAPQAAQRVVDDGVQRAPLADAITPLQRQEVPEEEELAQTVPLQRQEVPEEKLAQTVRLQRSGDGAFAAPAETEERLAARSGGGSPLPSDVRGFMEPRFGVDFSDVRVHDDGEARQLSTSVQAKAFTHGSDIYLGDTAGDLSATDGKRLLAHELTHVVQQTGTAQRRLRDEEG
jgi:hypothetical protein